MALVETLVVGVGGAVTKGLVRLWLKDSAWLEDGVDVATSLGDRTIGDFRDRRRLRRQLDSLQDLVADRLKAVIDAEFRNLPDFEAEAAAQAAASSVSVIAGLELAETLNVSGNPSALRRVIVSLDQDRPSKDLLSEGATALYQVLLTECCNYIVALTKKYSTDFEVEALLLVLRRETELLDIAREILDRIPKQTGGLTDPEQDKLQYKRDLARRLDTIELYGADLSYFRRSYTLSTAWVDLSVVERNATGSAIGSSMSAAHFLAESRRVLVRGAAGSGKTTLQRWLAVTLATDQVPSIMQPWSGLTPVYLQFRHLPDTQLPTVEALLHRMSPNTNDYIDNGQLIEDARSGRLAFFLDGLDEVVPESRPALRDWVLDLVERFPECRFVITSRPLAIDEPWISLPGFKIADVMPLTVGDIRSLVGKWYKTQLDHPSVVVDTDRQLISRMRDLLWMQLETSAPLREIAGTPLLCALLCALNLERSGELPKDRMELYKVALDVLLGRRDRERGLPRLVSLPLTLAESLSILQELAWWMSLNGRAVATPFEFQRAVERRLPHLSNVSESAEVVAKALLERSGVLRTPDDGSIDFIHRSFQEFLGAREATDGNHIDMLVSKAPDDDWHNVIAMASGHSTTSQREVLLTGLIKRGDETRKRTDESISPFHGVAAMCLEYATIVSPETLAAIQKRVVGLVPPESPQEFSLLVASGDLAARLVANWLTKRRSVDDVLKCVDVLKNLATRASMEVLTAIAVSFHHSTGVVLALLEAGRSFDPHVYAATVFGGLTVSVLDSHLTVGQAEVAELVEGIDSYAVKVVLYPEDSASDQPGTPLLRKAVSVVVEVAGCRDLSSLPTMPAATSIEVEHGDTLASLFGIQFCANVVEATFREVGSRCKIAPYALPTLKRIVVVSGSIVDVDLLLSRGIVVQLPT